MKNFILTSLLIFGLITHGFGQDNVNPKEMVGFGCYSSGEMSKPVVKVTLDLAEKNYKSVAKMLKSRNPAKKYLATISLIRLSELDEYRLSEKQNELIEEIRKSEELVSVCSGCTYFDQIKLKDLLADQKDNPMRDFAKYWLEENAVK